MDPLNKETRHHEARDRLARMAFGDALHNLGRIRRDPEFSLVWDYRKAEIISVLEKGERSIVEIRKASPKFEVKRRKELAWAFDDEKRMLVVDFWELLFQASCMVASGLVHELDRYQFLTQRS